MYPYYRDYDRVSGRGGEGMDHKRVHLCTLQATHVQHQFAQTLCKMVVWLPDLKTTMYHPAHTSSPTASHPPPPPPPTPTQGKGYTRGVTKPQFERVLHFLSIQVSPEDLKLIERKFESPVRECGSWDGGGGHCYRVVDSLQNLRRILADILMLCETCQMLQLYFITCTYVHIQTDLHVHMYVHM